LTFWRSTSSLRARTHGADPRARHERSHAAQRADRPGRDRAGRSDLEIGYAARNAREWDKLTEALQVYDLVETTADHVRRARQVQRLLAAKHQRGRKLPDLLIAAAAEAGGLAVLHYDADFDRIAAVTGQHCEWVVPSGSID
jgi:predicted nucleic acid-binding protein